MSRVTAVFIALSDELDRIRFMQSWLSSTQLEWQAQPGVIVSNIQDVRGYLSEKRRARFGYDLKESELGCFLAHRMCWQKCVSLGVPTLILESDVKPAEVANIDSVLSELGNLVEYYDIVRLLGTFKRNEVLGRKVQNLSGQYSLQQFLGDPMGAGAYLLTPHAAEVLLQHSEFFFQPVDVFLGATWMHKLRYRTVTPYPFETVDFDSVIGERRRPKQSFVQRAIIEAHRFADDVRRIVYIPWNFFR